MLSLRNLTFFSFFLFHLYYLVPTAPLPLPTARQPLLLYSTDNGQSLEDLVVQAIGKAEKSLHIATFNLNDSKIIKAIKEASERGVEVYVAVDKNGFKEDRDALGKATYLSQRAIKGLMHQKWVVVDEHLSLIGSANLTPESLKSHHNLLIGIESKTFSKQLLSESKKKIPSHLHPIGSHWKTSLSPYKLTSWTSPKNSDLKIALMEAIDSAKERLEIALFTFTEKELLEKVVDANKRGVKVSVLLDRGQAQGACYKTVLRLVQEKIPVALSKGRPLLHHKFVWIDRQKLFTGSFNWTKAALTQNEELLTLFEGGDPSDPFWKALESTWEKLEKKVEWQKNEDWSDRVWKNGASKSRTTEETSPDLYRLPFAA